MGPWQDSGLRVVELGSGIQAAFGARLLADFGADVIKVEPPATGDASRRAGPFPAGVADTERSGLFLYLNFGKRGVTLDPRTTKGAQLLAGLLAEADIVIENLGAGEFDRILPESARPRRLVVCSISHYGQSGPKAGYLGSELSAYASGGMMYMTGTDDRPPVKHGYNQASHLAGVNAASACLAAAMLAKRTGCGQRIDISEQETVAMTVFPALNVYTHTGAVVKRAPVDLPKLATSQAMEASDGWIMPSDAGIYVWWDTFASFVDRPELLEEPFASRDSRNLNESAIDGVVGPAFQSRTRADLFHGGQEVGLTMSAIQSADEIANCEHLDARGFFVEPEHPVAGSLKMPGMVPLTGGVIDRASSRPAPTLGQHNAEVYAALGISEAELEALRDAAVI